MSRMAGWWLLWLLCLPAGAWGEHEAVFEPEAAPEREAVLEPEAAPEQGAVSEREAVSEHEVLPEHKTAPDSVRIRGPVRVEGGRVLSTRQARAALRDTPAAISREAARSALDDLGRRLIAAGYLEAELRLRLLPGEPSVLEVEQGDEARWDTVHVRVESDRVGDSQGSGVRHKPPEGRFDPERFDRLLWSWVDAWTERGHPFAAARVESLLVDGGRVRAGVILDPGPRYEVQEVAFPGRTSTRPAFLERWIRFRPGALYKESEWQLRRRRLEQAGLFSRVGEPSPEVIASGGLRVLLPVEEGRHNRLEGAIAYSGATSALSGVADLDLGNVFGTGRGLGLYWERLQRDQSRLRVRVREPLLGPLPVGARASIEHEVRDSTYTQMIVEGVAEAWIAADIAAYAGAEYRRSVIGVEPSTLSRRLSSLAGGRWETMRPGRWQGGRYEVSFRSGHSRVRAAGGAVHRVRIDRADLDARRYWRPGGSFVILARSHAASLSRSDLLQPSEALRLGGAGSVRGYREDQFASYRYAAGQLELGFAAPEGRVYVFTDAAWFRPFAGPPHGRDLLGFGVGLSAETPSRRVQLDLGVPRGGALGDSRLHVRLETRF